MNAHASVSASDTPDFAAIKTKQNAAWSSGDYGRIGVTLQLVGEALAEAMDLDHGSHALDVAAGNGNVTLALARRGAEVTSTDYVPTLLAAGRRRAEADGLDVRFQTADAEELPFNDGAFDAVASTFGVMFAPNQTAAAAEMARVARPGGVIGMANWTPDSFIGRLFKTLGRFVPPPAGVQSPANWGDRAWLHKAFGARTETIAVVRKDFVFRYASPQAFVEEFRTWYGPTHKAFLALGEERAPELVEAILELVAEFNVANDGTMKVPSAYLEVVLRRG